MMVYNTQNYCFFGLCPSSGILKIREHNVSETVCSRPQIGGGGGDTYYVGSVRKSEPQSPEDLQNHLGQPDTEPKKINKPTKP
jgi:hypothetical protein